MSIQIWAVSVVDGGSLLQSRDIPRPGLDSSHRTCGSSLEAGWRRATAGICQAVQRLHCHVECGPLMRLLPEGLDSTQPLTADPEDQVFLVPSI